MAEKKLIGRQTIENLTSEFKKTFAKKDDITAVTQAAADALKSGKVDGNKVSFYTTTEQTGPAKFEFDFPKEMFLDQTETKLVQSFAFEGGEAYSGAEDPTLEGKPVLVLAVKTEGAENKVNYSFLDLSTLLDTYTAKADDDDNTTTVTVEGHEIGVKVNISEEAENALSGKEDGLYVPKVEKSETNGKLKIGGQEVDVYTEPETVLHETDIQDYSTEEIAALLADN